MRFIKKICFPALIMAVSLFMPSCKKEVPPPSNVIMTEVISAASGPAASWKEAKSKAYRAVKFYPSDPNARIMLALALEQCGQKNNALDEIKTAVKLDKDNFAAQFNLGRILMASDHYDEALGPLKTALKLSPGNQEVVILLARCSQILGLYDDAILYYKALSRGGRYINKPEALNEIAVIMVKKGEYQKAYGILQLALGKDQDNPSVILNLAIVCDKYMGIKPDALKLYQKYLELTLKNTGLKQTRAEVDARMKEISTFQGL